MKLLRWFFITALSLLLLVLGALFLLQSKWMKEQLSHIVQEIALQSGVQIKIEKIEGELPLKWTLTGVHAMLEDGDTLDIDKLQVRLALLPLLRGHIGVSYLHADHTEIVYLPTTSPKQPSIKKITTSFSIRSASFDEIILKNQKTAEQTSYNLKGRGRFGSRAFFVEGALHAAGFDANLYCEGDKKLDYIQANLDLAVRSQDAFAPFYTIPEHVTFEMKSRSEGPWKTWMAALFKKDRTRLPPITGTVDVNVHESPLPGPFQLSSKFALHANRSWELSHVAFLSRYALLQGAVKIEPLAVEASLHLPDLSYFSPHLKGEAQGQITLKDEKCHLTLTAPEFTLNTTTFTENRVELLGQIQKSAWNAAVEIEAHHPELGYTATAQLSWTPHGLFPELFQVKSLDLVSHIGRLAGDLTVRDLRHMHGGLSFQITDLAPLSELMKTPLAGQIGGEVIFDGDELSLHSIGKHFRADRILSSRFDLDISHVKLAIPLEGTLELRSDEAYFDKLHLNSFKYKMGWNTQNYDYQLETTGEWKGPFEIASKGKLDFTHATFELACDELRGQVLGKQIALVLPFNFEISKEAFKITTLDLNIDQGHLALTSHYDANSALLQMSAQHFPLDFLTLFSPRFSLQGLSSVDIDLAGKENILEGHANIILEHADIYPAGSVKPIQTKGTFQANLADGKMQLHTHLVASGEQLCDVSLSAPLSFHLAPLKFKIPGNEPIAGQCTIEGYTEQLFDFINLGSQRVGGFISTHLLLSGTLDHPILHGPLDVQGGFYENYFVGIAVKEAAITAHAQGSDLIIEQISATDGEKGTAQGTAQGTARASGVFHLRKGLPFESAGTLTHFRVIRFDWLTGACSGPFTLEGDMSSALAKGTLTLDEADVTIPDQLPSELPVLPITFINEPEDHLKKFNYSEDYPFRYDIEVSGTHDLRLSGRGIEAELEGDIHMTGQNLAVLATGALHTKKGKFSFAGKDFTITQGEILFSGEKSFLNITSSVEYPGLTITVYFRGDLRSPQLIFESNPSLPTSSILARILFNKDVSELTAGQAVQLASTIVTLSGSSGPNVLETIRKSLGVDRLSISANEETGRVAVQIGKYITQGVMISLIQSTETSHVKVEVELKMGFVLEAETQEDNQGKFSFKWNKNY